MTANDQEGLLVQATQALARLDANAALELLDEADRFGRTHNSLLNRALALRLLGDFSSSIRALDEALALQPYDFMALLAKAAMLEKLGHQKAAVEIYANALKIAPPPGAAPPAVTAQIEYAVRLVEQHAVSLRDYLQAEVADLREGMDDATRERFDEGLEI